jgi:hypothetical protein
MFLLIISLRIYFKYKIRKLSIFKERILNI